MHENKFEKQVREKMDQLGFDPSDAVWTQVNQAINKEKKKRKPIFWIFFLSGLILAGGAVYVATTRGVKNQDALKMDQVARSPASSANQSAEKKSGSFQLKKKLLPIAGLDFPKEKEKKNVEQNGAVEKPSEWETENIKQVPLQSGDADENKIGKESQNTVSASVEKKNTAISADTVSGGAAAKNKKQEMKKSSWSIVYTGSAGVSNIDQAVFQTLNTTNLSNTAYFPITLSSRPQSFGLAQSEIHAGFSFALAVSVKRKLSKRVSASLGLGYHYYSTTFHTGSLIDSTLTVYYNPAQFASVNSYYSNGNGKVFTNQYHFIELPVNASFQLNKSLKNPVSWEAGFSFSWLVSSNALLFDSYNNAYFKNSQLFNKIQWGATTAILIGLPFHNHSIQLGPQIQYALTSLSKDNSSYPGHLIYYGLKFSFNP